MTLASVLASALDPIKIMLCFCSLLALRLSHKWLAIALGTALIAYVCIAISLSHRPGAQLIVHLLSSLALLGLAALVMKSAGNLVGSAVGAAMCAASIGAVWFAISASAQSAVPIAGHELAETRAAQLAASEPKPAHSFLNVQAKEADPSNPELRWLSMQSKEYQAAILRGELPEDQIEQRKVGLLIMGLRQYFRDDADIAAFLLSPKSLPLLVELRSLLHDQLLHADDADGVHMLMYASAVRINSRVQSILNAIQAQAAM